MKNYVDSQDLLYNTSNNNFITSNNQSIVNWATSTFATLLSIVDQVGNWSQDKSNYYNTTQVNEINTSVTNFITSNNQSVVDYINWVNSTNSGLSYNDGWINETIYNMTQVNSINDSATNYINFIASLWNSNYTNMQNPCTPNFVTGIHENGTFICGTVEQASESDPY